MITIHDIDDPQPEDISPFYDNKHKDWDVIAVKGAPDMVLNLCTHYQRMDDNPRPLDEAARQRILAANDAMTQDALRVLGWPTGWTDDVPDGEDQRRSTGKRPDLRRPDRHDRPARARSEARPGESRARPASAPS